MPLQQHKVLLRPFLIFEIAIMVLIVCIVIILVPFGYWYPAYQQFASWKNLVTQNFALLLLFALLGILIHELTHGIIWAIYCKKRFRAISFGIDWKDFSPYCHCNEPLRLWQFYLGCAMPGIVTGVIPAIISLIIGEPLLAILSVFFIMAATADWITCFKLHQFPLKSWVKDSKDNLGCEIEFEVEIK